MDKEQLVEAILKAVSTWVSKPRAVTSTSLKFMTHEQRISR